MLSLKDFKEVSLKAKHQVNAIGGQCACITSQDTFTWVTDTGVVNEVFGYNDAGDVLKHEFYLNGKPYTGERGEK